MSSMKHLFARACAGLLLLAAGSYAAQAATGPAMIGRAPPRARLGENQISGRRSWRSAQTDGLARPAGGRFGRTASGQYGSRDLDGIITSERASLANEHGGLTGPVKALQYAMRARDFSIAWKEGSEGLRRGAPTSLGVLYYRVPGFPMASAIRRRRAIISKRRSATRPTVSTRITFTAIFSRRRANTPSRRKC